MLFCKFVLRTLPCLCTFALWTFLCLPKLGFVLSLILFTLFNVKMKIPFSNRTVDIDLPNVDGLNKITVKMVINDFLKHMPENFNTLLEAFVLISPRKVCVTCKTLHAMEEFCHSGLTFQRVHGPA